jgi:hypothetical protein
MTYFTTDAWALVPTGKALRAPPIAREADTRCSTRHAASAFMLTRPGTALNTWCAWFIAPQGATRMRTANLFVISTIIFNHVKKRISGRQEYEDMFEKLGKSQNIKFLREVHVA